MFDKPADAQRVGNYVDENIDVIINALHNHAERMTDAAELAQAQYDAGQYDPDTKAAQDRSLVTNNGYKHSAQLFEKSAKKARTVANTLRTMIDGPDENEGTQLRKAADHVANHHRNS